MCSSDLKLLIADENLIDVFIVPIGEKAHNLSVTLLQQLRNADIRSDMAYGERGLKGAMKAADKSGAKLAIVLGDEEVANARIQIKNLRDSSQVQVAISDMLKHVLQVIRQTKGSK